MKHPAAPGGPDEDLELDHEDPGLDPAVLRRRRDLVLTILAGLVFLAAALFSAQKFFRAPPRPEADILLFVQDTVRREMGPGVSIQYASEGRQVIAAGAGVYRVSGMFMAVGREGLPFYYAFDCTAQDSPKGELRVSSVNIIPLF